MQLEYTVVEAQDEKTFVARVNDLLEKGWDLQGGVCALAHGHGRGTLFQAMTRPLPL